jgi:hypothetical protein
MLVASSRDQIIPKLLHVAQVYRDYVTGRYVHEERAIGSRSSFSRFIAGQGFVVGVCQWRGQGIRNANLLCSLPSIIVAEVLTVKPSVVVAKFSDHWR